MIKLFDSARGNRKKKKTLVPRAIVGRGNQT